MFYLNILWDIKKYPHVSIYIDCQFMKQIKWSILCFYVINKLTNCIKYVESIISDYNFCISIYEHPVCLDPHVCSI